MRDIAIKLGVSEVTVSLALRDHPRISLKRRKQVQALAEEMGYRPNAMAAALAQRKWTLSPHAITNTLAWLNAWPDPSTLRRFHEFDAYWKGAYDAAEKRGYALEEFVLNESMPPARMQKILLTRNIRGILIPPHKEPSQLEKIDYNSFAVIRFGRTIQNPAVNLVSHSQAVDVAMALQTMTRRGYHRIGYVTSKNFRATSMFDAGYLKTQSGLPQKQQIPPLILHDRAHADAETLKKIHVWIRKYRPEAILTTEGNMKTLLEAAGYKVPGDVGLAATSVSDCDADAGIFQNPEEIGRVAAVTLIGLIQNSQFGIPEYHQDILVRGKWVDGKTLPNKVSRDQPSQKMHTI